MEDVHFSVTFRKQGNRPVLVNEGQGGSWRNISGGRSSFSLFELSEIALSNRVIFKELQSIRDSSYVTFARD